MSHAYTTQERERGELLALRAILLEVVSTIEELRPRIIGRLQQQVAKGLVKSTDETALPARDELVRDRMRSFLADTKTRH